MFDLCQRVIPQLREGLLLETDTSNRNQPDVPSVFPKRLTTPALTRAAAAAAAAAEQTRASASDASARNSAEDAETVAEDGSQGGPTAVPFTSKSKKEVGDTDGSTGSGAHCPMPRCFFAIGSPLGMFQSIRLSKATTHAPKFFQGLDVRWPASSM